MNGNVTELVPVILWGGVEEEEKFLYSFLSFSYIFPLFTNSTEMVQLKFKDEKEELFFLYDS
jgi:hypothetical protein